jgi:GAF domain-containing protein
VVAVDEVLVIEDVTKDPRFAGNPLLLEKGIRFYAGAPLRTAAGLILGSLCVIDTKPRTFSEEESRTLQSMADELMARVEAGAPGRGEAVG